MQPSQPEIINAVKWRQVGLLAMAELLAMTLWFSASAVVPQLTEAWQLSTTQQAWMTMSVQLGFVIGALVSAALNLPDRLSSRLLFGCCALLGAAANAAIPLWAASFGPALGLRLLTGMMLAGVYPPGMKLVATWCKDDRGIGIGVLVGALAVGSAVPHLLSGFTFLSGYDLAAWETVMLLTSGQAVLAGLLVLLGFRSGPWHTAAAPFNWRFAGKLFTERPSRLANFGYLGHMWELFAMWTWVPLVLLHSFRAAGWSDHWGHLAGFGVIAVGGIGCVIAGRLADRYGRTLITIVSLVLSGGCALVVGHLVVMPLLFTAACLFWGFTVVADSAQFSAAISELSDPRYVGTALTVQTSLGFLLTMLTIHFLAWIAEHADWSVAFSMLAIGPVVGVVSMYRLRRLPEAMRMASGRR